MIDLEDLPRLQSLSPARDIDDDYPQTLLEPILMDPNPKKKVTVRVPIGPPSKMTKLIKPTVASTPSTPSLETPPTPVVQSTRNLTWRGEFQFTTLESEIAEVLYKQDVDLGFSLDQEQIINASYASGNSAASQAKAKAEAESKPADPSMSDSAFKDSDDTDEMKATGAASVDDIEKLKALEELQEDKDKAEENPLEEITNEWNGIPFTIDNETGEYIRLPLDELLNDVLKLSEFPLEDELTNDPAASTSQAAAALNENQSQRITSETGEDLLTAEGVAVQQRKINTDGRSTRTNSGQSDFNDSSDNFPLCDFDDLQSSVGSPLFDLDDDAKKELDEMLQSKAPPYPHPNAHDHPHAHGHPYAHPHSHHHAAAAAAHHHHAHAHHAAAAAAAHQRAVQQANANYGGVGSAPGSAFQRQPSAAGGFHHGHHQSRMPRLNHSVSMERLQDFATYFSPIPSMVGGVSDMPPYPHHPHYPGYSYQSSPSNGAAGGGPIPPVPGQHGQYGSPATAALQPPPPPPPPHHAAMLHHPNAALGDLCSATAASGQPHYGHNLGSAVTSSMHLTNSSHEAEGAAAAAAAAGNAYKMEHDLMYYANTSSDMNQTDGFMNSIFTDEDLQMMDMNESFCRMVDNSTSNNSSVLGLPGSGHVSHAAGSAQLVPGNHGTANGGSSVGGGGASMSGGASSVGAAGGMTADILASGGGAAQGGTDRLDASSDSAVSSMGSERVPSLSDGEWGEGSDSAQDYHQGKYGGPYDFSYNHSRISTATRQPPVAQKKHQLYGKRDPHKQVPSALPPTVPPATAHAQAQAQSIKYEYDAGYAGMASGGVAGLQHSSVSEPGAMGPALSKEYHQQAYGMGASSNFPGDYGVRPPPRTSEDLVQLNHTYSLPQGSGSLPRPQARDKKPLVATKNASKAAAGSSAAATAEDEHLTRDEKRARSLNIPISVQDIINLPMDEFNERLSKYDLSENQLSLIRDIRRRGKNKVAAQNCRKRKLDQILSLEDEVNAVVKRKTELSQARAHLESERKRISNKFAMLHRHVFQYLRDPDGNPCSPTDYSLQQAANGSVYLLPRDKSEGNSTATNASNAVSSAGTSNLNGHGPVAPPMHGGHHSQHHQPQHVDTAMSQHVARMPPHLQQQQQQSSQHHHQQQPGGGGGSQQQQHHKE
ncbi:segmentation protein cap'n'collar isoform X2 [Drosophila miranda]|uniref:segmentation protein cap'n'collar isoform X2 n=1 Tax=Drosophila miranda TaxID=7229 RepID=UPI0007E6B2F0|nr:segmentation protein cap'n'collar isoform X2 [Drosophila miranda]